LGPNGGHTPYSIGEGETALVGTHPLISPRPCLLDSPANAPSKAPARHLWCSDYRYLFSANQSLGKDNYAALINARLREYRQALLYYCRSSRVRRPNTLPLGGPAVHTIALTDPELSLVRILSVIRPLGG